eukprot:jgi/Ulvmu1/2278/UM013_0125.1
MSDGPDKKFTPKLLNSGRPVAARFREPTFSILASQLWLANVQLTTVAGAAILAKTAVAPFERVKLLRQLKTSVGPHAVTSKQSILTSLRRIVRSDGWLGLYRGNGMNTIRLGPEVLLKFAVHDQLRILCGATAVDPSQISTPTRVAAASATGLLRTALLHPLSVLRTRLTADTGAALRAPPAATSAAAAAPPAATAAAQPQQRLYRGIWHCARETWARERLAGLYRGAGAAAVTTVPYLALCFGTYDVLSTQLPSDKHSQRQWWYPIAKMGTAAGACIVAQGVTYPLDTIRRRLEVSGSGLAPQSFAGMLDCASAVVRREGTRALYGGCLANTIKIVPSAALQFMAYDSLKMLMSALDPATVAAARL